jgi:hypothetical protein
VSRRRPAPHAVSDELDEGSAARFLGFRFGHGERSFFRQIQELPPAHRLDVTASTEAVPSATGGSGGCGRLAAGRRGGLRGASSRFSDAPLRTTTAGLAPEQVALSSSGGLDSTALAALAPRGVRPSPGPSTRPEGDERPQSNRCPVTWTCRPLGAGRWAPPLCGDFTDRFVHRARPTSTLLGVQVPALPGRPGSGVHASWSETAATPSTRRGSTGFGTSSRGGGPGAPQPGRHDPPGGPGGPLRAPGAPPPAARTRAREGGPPTGPPGLPRRPAPPCRRRRSRRSSRRSPPGPSRARRRRQARRARERGARLFAAAGSSAATRSGPGRSSRWCSASSRRLVPPGRPHQGPHPGGVPGALPQQVLESPGCGLLGEFFLRGIELNRRRSGTRSSGARGPTGALRRADWLETHLEATRSIRLRPHHPLAGDQLRALASAADRGCRGAPGRRTSSSRTPCPCGSSPAA